MFTPSVRPPGRGVMQMVFSETAKHARHSKLHSLTPVITAIPTWQEKRTHSEQGRDYVLGMLLMCLHARSEDADKMEGREKSVSPAVIEVNQMIRNSWSALSYYFFTSTLIGFWSALVPSNSLQGRHSGAEDNVSMYSSILSSGYCLFRVWVTCSSFSVCVCELIWIPLGFQKHSSTWSWIFWWSLMD